MDGSLSRRLAFFGYANGPEPVTTPWFVVDHLISFSSFLVALLLPPSFPALRWSYLHTYLSLRHQTPLPSCHKSEEAALTEGTLNDPVVIKGAPESPPTPPTSLHLLVPPPYLVPLNPAPVSVIAEKDKAKEMRFIFLVFILVSPVLTLATKK